MVKYVILSGMIAVVVGLSLSWVINDHFENYEKKCVSVNTLYEAGRKTTHTHTEVPCP